MTARKPIRPIPEGRPDEQAAYEAMVDRVVARDNPRPPEFRTRLGALIRAGQKEGAA